MRKLPAFLATIGLSAVTLVGCAAVGAPGSCPRPVDSDPAVSELVTVSGQVGSQPDIEIYTPFHTTHTATHDVEVGDGVAVTTDAQLVVLDLTIVSGETGETLLESGYSGDLAAFQLSALTESIPAFTDALHCATEGSRVVVALAPGDIAEQAAASIGLGEDESAVAVVDVHQVYLPRADGSLVFNVGNGLPTVVRAPDGRPGIIVPDAVAPTETTVQTLIRGTGETVTGDEPVRVHYTGVLWDDRTVFDSSWDREPASFTLDAVVPGFAEALRGQTVGSQVMVVVPPEEGYGDEEQPGIPAGSTLVFVIDILGLDQVPAE